MRSINLQKKSETDVFPVRTKQASSIKFLLLWLYFKFPDGTAHFIGNYYKMRKFFLLRHFPRTSAKIFGQSTKKRFLLHVKVFSFEYLFTF